MNIKNIRNKAYVMAHGINRKKLYKSGKLWLVGSATLFALMGGANAISRQSVHAANVDQPNVTAKAKTSQIKANPQASNSAYTVKSSTPSSVASQSNNNNSNNFQIKSIATNNVENSNIQNSANNLHSKLINSRMASALVGNNSGENSTRIFSNEPSNLKISSNKLGSASNSDSNASTPNYIEDHAHYNLGSYNSRTPVSTEAQSNAYQAYLKANPQLASLYNETANQSSSNNSASSKVASNAPKDNVSASSINSNSSASSVSANNSKVSSANQISDKKNKPLMLFGAEANRALKHYNATNLKMPAYATGKWGTATWIFNNGNLSIQNGKMSDNIPSWFNQSDGTNMSDGIFWSGYAKPMVNADYITSINTNNVEAPVNAYGLFSGDTTCWSNQNLVNGRNPHSFNNVKSIDLSGLNTINTHNMGDWFNGLQSLQHIIFGPNFRTDNVHNMFGMFKDDHSLQSLDLSSFNTQNVSDFQSMFWDVPSLQSLDLSHFKIKSGANVESFLEMFNYGSLNELTVSSDFKNIANNIGLQFVGSKPLRNAINGNTANTWANAIAQSGNWLTTNNNDHQAYNVQLIDVLTNQPTGNTIQVDGLKNSQFLPINSAQLPNGFEMASNSGTTAKVINSNTATFNVINKNNVAFQGRWGHAEWALLHNGNLIITNGTLDINQAPVNLSNIANMVYSITTRNATAPADSSNLLKDFTNANNIDLTGMNFEHSYNVKNILPPNTNANVNYNSSFDTALNTQETDDSNTENSEIASDNGKISSLNNSLVAETTRASNAVASASQSATNSASNAEKNAETQANTDATSSANSALAKAENSIASASSSASQSVSSLANSLTASLSAASSALNWIKSSGNSAYNNASNGSAQATSNSGWIHSNSGSLSQASNEASEASASANTNADNIKNIQTGLSNYNTVSSDATKAISSLASEDTRIGSNVANNSSQSAWISSAKGTLSTLSGDVKNIQDNTADNTAITSLSSAVKTASNIASEASASAIINQNWIHSNSASLSNASAEANQASTSTKTNATNISNLSGKVKTDEKSLASASTSASSVAKWLTSDSATLSSASNSAQSAYNYYTTNSASISNVIKEASNTSLAQSSFNTAYTNASKAESWINGNSGSFSALSRSISTLSGKVDADKQNLDNAIATKANASDISDYITVLDHDISINNSLVNQANQLANDNSNAINNLKANTAITLTFIKNGQLFGTPTTLTNSYIEQNATPETGTTKGQPGTYNVTSLLENSLPSGYNISNAYTVTIGSNENGTATMNLGNGDKKFALGATRDNSNDINTLTLGTPSQQAKAWNYVQNGINHNDFDNKKPLLKDNSTNPSAYVPNTTDAKNNPINISGNPVDYSGNITLNFVDNNNQTIKSLTVPYQVNAHVGDNVNLLNNALNTNLNATPNSEFLNTVIQNFDTHNFTLENGNKSSDYDFNVSPNANPNHNTNVVTLSPSLTFTFKANNETETINYIDEATNKNVGTGSVNGADDTQGVVTSKNANNLPKDYQIINNAPFTFTQNGSVNVLVAKEGTENKDNSNDTHSNVPNAKPTKPSDVAHTFTVTVNDHYNSDGKQQTKTYQKYVVEKGAEGSKFTVSPSDYTTYGYNMNASDKPVTGTITNNGLSTNGITWSFTAKKASSDNNSGNYKPSDVTPNNVTPSDLTKNPSANNPQNNNNVDNAKHGYATLYLVKRINGQNHNVTVRTINENNLDTTANYDIKASDYTPTGYKTTSSDNDLTGHIKTDGSLSNGTATFYYDVNASDIAPISITDINQDGDCVNANTGSDLGKSDTNNEATYTIGSKYLSTLGALGDYVNITNLLQAPNGYHLNNVNNAVSTNGTALNHIQLTKPTGVSLSNPLGAMKFVLTLPSRYTPKQEMTSEASEVQSDVGSATNWANNTSLSDSTRKSINSDIHSMNDDNVAIRQHITGGTNGSKAAKPFYSNASSAYANASAMANSGILSASTKARSQAESADAMNAKSASASSANPISNLVITGSTGAKSQSNSANHQSSNSQWIPRNPISDKSHHNLKNVSRKGLINLRFGTLAKYNGYKVSRVSLKGIRYFKVYKAILLHTDPMSVGRARNYKGRITPRMHLTLTVTKAFKLVRNHHTYYRFLLNFNHHDYFITANPKFVRNAYLPLTHRMNHRHVHVFRTVFEYKHVDHDMKLILRKGHTVKIRRIKKLGKYNRTRVQLSNGNWITANLNFISVI